MNKNKLSIIGLILIFIVSLSAQGDTLATGVYMEHSNGSKTAFFGFDALSLNTSLPDMYPDHATGYYWIGVSSLGPLPNTLDWMGVTGGGDLLSSNYSGGGLDYLPNKSLLNENSSTNKSQISNKSSIIESDVIISSGTRRNDFGTSRSTADTMSYCAESGGQFIFTPGDYMLMKYQMPSDGIIKGVNVPVFEWAGGEDDLLEVSIWKLNYPNGSDGNAYSTGNVDGTGWLGYAWDGSDHATADIEGDAWYSDAGTCAETAAVPMAQDPLMQKAWPELDFLHATLAPSTNPAGQDNWIATSDFGSEPTFLQGEWVGILVENQGTMVEYTGFYYCEGEGIVDPWVFSKFYSISCDGTSGETGWHIRHWVIDTPLAVELTGDRGPNFSDFTVLATTLSTDARPVEADITDDNPGGGDAGVESVSLFYTPDSVWTEIAMTMTAGTSEDGTWGATIPGQPAGTQVSYYFSASDVGDPVNTTVTAAVTYTHFQASQPTLFINNSLFGNWVDYYYFAGVADTTFTYDVWSYGGGTAELWANYTTVVDVEGGGPYFCIDDASLADWLDMGNKNLIIAGDEWLGTCVYGWNTSCGALSDDVVAGEFAYDYMGIDEYYADINYCIAGDQSAISRMIPVEGNGISGDLWAFLGDSLVLNYDPGYEIDGSNWLDGVSAVEGAMVSYYGVSGDIIDMSVDPVDNEMPTSLVLSQNYPNPFNPVTNISFVLPEKNNVNLTIYNLLGEEVTTLVNSELNAGTHNLVWDGMNNLGSPVSSGVYIYKVSTHDHSSSKKMLLLK